MMMRARWQRLKSAVLGRWMLPGGPEPHCGDECLSAATRFGYEARLRFAASGDSENHLADNGEWSSAHESILREDWEREHPDWDWETAREHIWRAWAVAGSGDTYERSLH